MAGRIMALDVGERRIGIALSDPGQTIGSPHSTLQRTSLERDLAALTEVVREQEVVTVVVGMPRSLSGGLHFQAEVTAAFIERLRPVLGIPIETWDERFTTAEANRALTAGGVRKLRRAQLVDQTAAALILQSFLASRN